MIRPRHDRLPMLALALAALVSFAPPAEAQIGGLIKKKAQEAAKKKLEEKVTKDEPADAAATSGSESTGAVAMSGGKVGEGAWANYDFKPGDRPLYVDDWTRDAVGNFPRRLELVDGNLEIVEWQGRRFLRGTSNPSTFEIRLNEPLPERFTIEFDLKLGLRSNPNVVFFGPKDKTTLQHATFTGWWDSPSSGTVDAGLRSYAGKLNTTRLEGVPELLPVRIMVDGRYAKVFIGSTRVANVPNSDLGRANAIHFALRCSADDPCFVGPIRLMAGGRQLYEALNESGRVATQGIYFDTGSDVIKPESTPTLKEIGQMLSEHPDLKLTIEGHTDNSGDAAANLALSEKRAAAVRAYLLSKHGVDGSRINFKGLGATKPAAPNTTPEARQQNRRVELVKVP